MLVGAAGAGGGGRGCPRSLLPVPDSGCLRRGRAVCWPLGARQEEPGPSGEALPALRRVAAGPGSAESAGARAGPGRELRRGSAALGEIPSAPCPDPGLGVVSKPCCLLGAALPSRNAPGSGRSLGAPGLGSVGIDAIGAEGSCLAGAEACHLRSSSGLRVNEVMTVSQSLSGPMVAGVGKAKKEVREGFLEALWEGCKHALGEAGAKERTREACCSVSCPTDTFAGRLPSSVPELRSVGYTLPSISSLLPFKSGTMRKVAVLFSLYLPGAV